MGTWQVDGAVAAACVHATAVGFAVHLGMAAINPRNSMM
jgi:hypothetical protein